MKQQHSEEIYRRAMEVLPGGVSRNNVFREPFPNYVNSASGSRITDIDGVTRIDFANNMASLIHGHSYPPIVEAVTKQMAIGTAYTLATAIEVAFAEHMCGRTPGFDKIRFVNSGTEAVMAMIKASRAFTGRPKIAKAEGAYHGTYDYAEISYTASPATWGNIDNPNSVPVAKGTPVGLLDDVIIFPYNDVERTLTILNKHAEDIACVMLDPVAHRIGMIPLTSEFVEAVYDWTRKNGALFVFDEVISYRVNYRGAQADFHVKPDLTALGKIIGGGFPVGGIAGKEEIMEVMNPREKPLRYPHTGTFSANPITMTAGYIAMTHFDEEAVLKVNKITEVAKKQIAEAAAIADIPLAITGAGSLFRLHFALKAPNSYRDALRPKKAQEVMNKFLDYLYYKSLIVTTNTCALMPSTATSQNDIDTLSEKMLVAFKDMKGDIQKAAAMPLLT